MFTRLWQHRYSGLLATLLVGLAAAVLVMLLPDRQQAFARFMVDPVVADSPLGPQTLMNDQRLISRVLQRLEIESPNLIDPRPVDPLTAFQRNFGLRSTGTPGEFEISYVSRSPEQAAAGIKTWLSAASDIWSLGQPADTASVSPDVSPDGQSSNTVLAEIEAAKALLATRRDRQQALSIEQSQLTEQLAAAQSAKERFEAEQAKIAAALTSNRQARETVETQSELAITKAAAELDSAEKELGVMQATLTQLSAQAKQAADRLTQMKQEQTQAAAALASAQQNLQTAQALKTDFASGGADSGSDAQARNAQADRQRAAIAEDLKQAIERGISLERRLAQTPPTIVEVVTQNAPVAPTGDYASRQRLIAEARDELSELRVRFTDNHPDVRRQLAILSDLESPTGENNLIEAPTVGARPEVRPNPQHAIVKDAVAQNQTLVEVLRQRVDEMEAQRTQFVSQQAQAPNNTNTAQQNQAQLSRAERALASAQAAVARAERDLQAAETSAAETSAAQAAQSDAVSKAELEVASQRSQLAALEQTAQRNPNTTDPTATVSDQPTALASAETEKERQALDDKLKGAEQSLASLDVALEENDQQIRQATDSLAARQSAANEIETLGLARGGMTLVQGTQVVPASTSPDRTRFLFLGLLASLVSGVLLALVLSARRTAFGSVAQLEQVTGLRALGGVPRFKTARQTMGFWVSAAWFALLILIYGLVYLGFIALVESESSLLQPDWAAWRDAGLGLLRNGASKIGVSEQWLAGLGENR